MGAELILEGAKLDDGCLDGLDLVFQDGDLLADGDVPDVDEGASKQDGFLGLLEDGRVLDVHRGV